MQPTSSLNHKKNRKKARENSKTSHLVAVLTMIPAFQHFVPILHEDLMSHEPQCCRFTSGHNPVERLLHLHKMAENHPVHLKNVKELSKQSKLRARASHFSVPIGLDEMIIFALLSPFLAHNFPLFCI